jgi:nucleotide-binding universal stress UspA family protein
MYRRILVATDGEPGAAGALRMARLLEQRLGSEVEVFAACEAGDFYELPPLDPRHTPPQLPSTALEAVRSRVQVQLAEVGDAALAWPVTVEQGAPGPAIVRYAARRDSSLILLGLSALPAERFWFGRETLRAVVELSSVPVYALPESTSRMPQEALVALDFSPSSLEAARQAMRLLAPHAKLHLAHVLVEPAANGDGWDRGLEWAERYRPETERRLDELARELRGHANGDPQVHELRGEPAVALLELASQEGADVLVLGSHGHGFIGREKAGSTCSRLIRGAPCALFIVPPPSAAGKQKGTNAQAEARPGAPRPMLA